MKANRIEPPHTTQRLNNNVITISTLNNGNSKTMTVILLHVNSRKTFLNIHEIERDAALRRHDVSRFPVYPAND